ncbi:hypothetical protein LCGC14_2491300 [marine sediment metagenome]|uniref:Com family DNA-binding transcriptional regulator n=1 Tax=marine sediment metagenome TaxID=412755 RepID=A0A0F9B4R8_9ZZZZ
MMLAEYRCRYCNALLLKAELRDGVIEIKCRHVSCGMMNRFDSAESRRVRVNGVVAVRA